MEQWNQHSFKKCWQINYVKRNIWLILMFHLSGISDDVGIAMYTARLGDGLVTTIADKDQYDPGACIVYTG